MFLEQDIDNTVGDRYGRWWAAHGSGTVVLPLVMVDSGHQISNGYVDFYNVYKAMIDTELGRPAEADLEAYSRRIGNRVRVYGRLTNLSGVTLSYANYATIHTIVYEDARVHLMDHFVRDSDYLDMPSSLAHGAAMTFTLETSDLTGVNWDNLHSLALVDYRPGDSSGAFDMLQATYAIPVTFTVQPSPLNFLIDSSEVLSQSVSISMHGPHVLNWTATEEIPWLTLTASAGPINMPPAAIVSTSTLSPGWQSGVVTFTAASADGLAFTAQVPASAYYGPTRRVFLPVSMR